MSMVNKKNAERLVELLIIFFTIFIIYVLISSILNITKESSLNSITDAMTFSVTALTPITAILLYGDWRQQHVSVLFDEYSSKILKIFKSSLEKWIVCKAEIEDWDQFIAISSEQKLKKIDDLFSEIHEAISLLGDLKSRTYLGEKFCKKSNELLTTLSYITIHLNSLEQYYNKERNPGKFNFEYFGESESEFIERMKNNSFELSEQLHNDYSILVEELDDFEKMVDALKIKY